MANISIKRPYVHEKDLVGVKDGGAVWKSFRSKYPHLADDLYEEMVLAVMNANEAMKRQGGLNDPRAWAYRRKYVRGVLSKYVARTPCVSVSLTTFVKHTKENKTIKKVNTFDPSTRKKVARTIFERTDRQNQIAVFDLKELIFSCCSDDRERTIVELMLQGYDQTELLEVLPEHGIHVKRSRLGQIITEFRLKLEKVLEWKSLPLKNGESGSMQCKVDYPTLTESLPLPMELLQSSQSSFVQAAIL